ncbi:CoA pyrophosphatase [Telmatospirillum siberiense]|uniref:CoA pyrophosphatase n=1 Tax=Telmatospirillum siberiense TaxID=382514 RepID=UPI001F52FA4B|nr:CoA pyrophosphatase [Telmatospirillum siberiense]
MAASRTAPSRRSDAETSRLLGDAIGSAARAAPTELVPAAVLVPLVRREDGLTVLLTQRTAHLSHHGGQISFPGGRMEPEDADPTAAALRETREEIGLPSEAVDVLGRLDDYVTVTGFKVAPVVGLIHPPFTLVPESFEVQEIFEVPLSFVLNPVNHQRHSRVTPAGETRHFYAIPFGERYIWGATAAMLVNFYETLVR